MNNIEIEKLTQMIDTCEDLEKKSSLCVERAKVFQSLGNQPKAIDDFNEALRLNKDNKEAQQYLEHIYEILNYRYWDTYMV